MGVVQSKLDVGDKLIGAKLGLTSRAEQEAMGVTEPLYGWITSGMIAGAGQPVDRHSLIQPRGAGDRLPVGPRRHRACDRHQRAGRHQRPSSPRWISSTPGYRDYRSPCRMSSPTTPARDGSCSAPRPADLVDLRLVGCALRAGGPWRPRRRGRSWGHPAAALAWLANCLGPRGERLRAGWLVLSGGLTAPVPLEPGQAVTAELDGLGSVEVYSR